jgi:hypothetical protein
MGRSTHPEDGGNAIARRVVHIAHLMGEVPGEVKLVYGS